MYTSILSAAALVVTVVHAQTSTECNPLERSE